MTAHKGKGKSVKGEDKSPGKGKASPCLEETPAAGEGDSTVNPWGRCVLGEDAKKEGGGGRVKQEGAERRRSTDNPVAAAKELFGRGEAAERRVQAALDGEALALRSLTPPA